MTFKTQFSDKPLVGSKEVFTKPSMTEPDNTMTIPEIIARYTRGQGLGVNTYPWQQGVAPEDGESQPQDVTIEQVLDIQQPTPAAAPLPAPQEPEPAAAPAAAEPSPEPAPAGAGA